jgi:hypothetical protein
MAAAAPEPAHAPASSRRRLLDTPWFLLLILFGVAAVFGLPLLWYSRGFSRPMKAVLTVVVIVYTALLLWLTWLILRWCYASLARDLRGVW